MKEKTVYVNQWQGKDVNDGLSEDMSVLSNAGQFLLRQ